MATRRGGNALYELSVTLARGSDHTTAIALRMLAREGYETLDQVDAAPDWNLLAIPRMGVKRMMAVRRLTRRDWRPPTPHAIEAANWLLTAACLALRFWPAEALESAIRGSGRPPCGGVPVEGRIALDSFVLAAQKARLHCKAEELVQVVHHIERGPTSLVALNPRPFRQLGTAGPEPLVTCHSAPVVCSPVADSSPDSGVESAHYAFPRQKRREIVEEYRRARQLGEIANKDRWAWSRHSISGRTLSRYEREYLADEERAQ